MSFLRKTIFWYSRKVPASLREVLGYLFLFYIKTVNFLKYKNKDLFHHVNIELSRDCNRRCPYCPVSKYPEFKKDEKLTFEDYQKIIKELKELNFSGEIHFTGYYEPLLEKDLIKYIKHAKKELKKVKIVVYTNGDYLGEDILKEFRKLSVFLIISIHGERERNKKHKKIKEMTESNNVIIKKNIEEGLLSSRGGLVGVKKKDVKTRCILPSVELTIDSSGSVIICSDDFFSQYVFGNIKKESILKTWNKEKFRRARKNILLGKPSCKICKNCSN